jgi:hypothetical protein
MRLSEWIAQRPRGEITRLMRVTGISYAAMHALSHDKNVALFRTAVIISEATGGAVTVRELCTLPPLVTPKRVLRRRPNTSPTSCAAPKLASARE